MLTIRMLGAPWPGRPPQRRTLVVWIDDELYPHDRTGGATERTAGIAQKMHWAGDELRNELPGVRRKIEVAQMIDVWHNDRREVDYIFSDEKGPFKGNLIVTRRRGAPAVVNPIFRLTRWDRVVWILDLITSPPAKYQRQPWDMDYVDSRGQMEAIVRWKSRYRDGNQDRLLILSDSEWATIRNEAELVLARCSEDKEEKVDLRISAVDTSQWGGGDVELWRRVFGGGFFELQSSKDPATPELVRTFIGKAASI